MTPHTQRYTVFEHGCGDCWRAAVASVLDLPLDAVPHTLAPRFVAPEPPEIFNAPTVREQKAITETWAWMVGYRMVLETDPAYLTQPFVIASGVSPRTFPEGHERAGQVVHHAVVYGRHPDGAYRLAHDPIAGGTGLVGEPEIYYEFHRIDADRP